MAPSRSELAPASIGVQPWMGAEPTRAVIAALEAAGGADCARFVGGCVRNALMSQPVADIDIATRLVPQRVVEALRAARLKAVPTGIDHGTVTAVAAGAPFEITTLRRDVETDGRRAVVAFTEDWAEDAMRRDFRLNALYADRDGRVFDPTGQGVDDARAGRIVFVGDAKTRILEDGLRILRFFRFYAWYGQGEADRAALSACRRLRERLTSLSAERVSKELLKLLAAADPRPAVALMRRTGVLRLVLPEAARAGRLERAVGIDSAQGLAADPLLRLAALLPRDPAIGAAVARRLRLSNAERDRLSAALGRTPPISPQAGERALRTALYWLGADVVVDRARLTWAASSEPDAAWTTLIEAARAWRRPAFPVSGTMVKAAGVPYGPQVGEVLGRLETWWVRQDFAPGQAALEARLQRMVR